MLVMQNTEKPKLGPSISEPLFIIYLQYLLLSIYFYCGKSYCFVYKELTLQWKFQNPRRLPIMPNEFGHKNCRCYIAILKKMRAVINMPKTIPNSCVGYYDKQWYYPWNGVVTMPLHGYFHNVACEKLGKVKKKKSKLRITGLCAGNSPVIGEFLAQRGQ